MSAKKFLAEVKLELMSAGVSEDLMSGKITVEDLKSSVTGKKSSTRVETLMKRYQPEVVERAILEYR